MTITRENETSIAVEESVLRLVTEEWMIGKSWRFPQFAPADYAIRGDLPLYAPGPVVREFGGAVLEIKGRSRNFIGHADHNRWWVEVSEKKLLDLVALGADKAARTMLAFVFLRDRVVYWLPADVAIEKSSRRWGGRKARAGSANDQEWMRDISLGLLLPIRGTIDGDVADAAIRYNEEHAT